MFACVHSWGLSGFFSKKDKYDRMLGVRLHRVVSHRLGQAVVLDVRTKSIRFFALQWCTKPMRFLFGTLMAQAPRTTEVAFERHLNLWDRSVHLLVGKLELNRLQRSGPGGVSAPDVGKIW